MEEKPLQNSRGDSHLGKRRYQSIYPFQNRKIFCYCPLFKFLFVFDWTGSSSLHGLSLAVVTAEDHLLIAMCGTPVAEHGVQGAQTSEAVAHGLNSCCSQKLENKHNSPGSGRLTPLLRGIQNLPESEIEPMPPALAGGLFTTEFPGKTPPSIQICKDIKILSLEGLYCGTDISMTELLILYSSRALQ